jgi:hypothetical protein
MLMMMMVMMGKGYMEGQGKDRERTGEGQGRDKVRRGPPSLKSVYHGIFSFLGYTVICMSILC